MPRVTARGRAVELDATALALIEQPHFLEL